MLNILQGPVGDMRRTEDVGNEDATETGQCKVAKTRKFRGNVRIQDVCVNGNFVVLENVSTGNNSKPQLLSGWTVVRRVEGGLDISYELGDYILQPGAIIKIHTKSHIPDGTPVNCVVNERITTWGTGPGVTTLYDHNMKERASLITDVDFPG